MNSRWLAILSRSARGVARLRTKPRAVRPSSSWHPAGSSMPASGSLMGSVGHIGHAADRVDHAARSRRNRSRRSGRCRSPVACSTVCASSGAPAEGERRVDLVARRSRGSGRRSRAGSTPSWSGCSIRTPAVDQQDRVGPCRHRGPPPVVNSACCSGVRPSRLSEPTSSHVVPRPARGPFRIVGQRGHADAATSPDPRADGDCSPRWSPAGEGTAGSRSTRCLRRGFALRAGGGGTARRRGRWSRSPWRGRRGCRGPVWRRGWRPAVRRGRRVGWPGRPVVRVAPDACGGSRRPGGPRRGMGAGPAPDRRPLVVHSKNVRPQTPAVVDVRAWVSATRSGGPPAARSRRTPRRRSVPWATISGHSRPVRSHT